MIALAFTLAAIVAMLIAFADFLVLLAQKKYLRAICVLWLVAWFMAIARFLLAWTQIWKW